MVGPGLVVPGSHAGPARQHRSRREARHVRASLGDDDLRDAGGHARDGDRVVMMGREGLQLTFDLLVEGRDLLIDEVDVTQCLAGKEGVVVVEVALYRAKPLSVKIM